jgi:histidine triad (HIT) family protein
MKTIFEKIIDREIPADIVYEDDISMAFLDINPVTKGHTLLISKQPYPWMTDVPDQEIAHVFSVAKKIMIIMKNEFRCDFVQVGVVGTDVPHFHIHLIPRSIQEDKSHIPPDMRHHEPYIDDSEKQTYIDNIKNNL